MRNVDKSFWQRAIGGAGSADAAVEEALGFDGVPEAFLALLGAFDFCFEAVPLLGAMIVLWEQTLIKKVSSGGGVNAASFSNARCSDTTSQKVHEAPGLYDRSNQLFYMFDH